MNTKSNFLKSIFISLILLVGTASAWAGGGIYLKPNSNWTKDNARFAAYFFKSSNNSDSKWMSMYASNKSGYYVCAIPDGYDMVVFCRMNGGNQTNDWNNKWNQTGNLNVPSDEKIVCSINPEQWDCGNNVTWSAINWYIVGDFNGWNTTANKMPCDISIESGNHTMKIVSEYGDWFGNTGTMIRGNSSGWTMTYGENSNCTLTADVAGTYNFSCTGTKLTVTYPKECFLKGDFNDWSNTHSILGGSVTINLKAGTYEFKIQRYDATSAYWVSNNGTMTRENCSDWTMYDDVDKNCKITADFDGDYTFTYDRSTGKLSVTYPTAYKVTYGVGTNKGTASVTTSPNITSGSLALPSTSITFSKGATKEGYTWKGWYSNAAGTGTKLGDGTTYTSTNRTGDISVYACYDLITYTITYNLNDGTNPNDAPTSYNVTTNDITLPTTPTKTGYTFAGWYDNAELTGNAITQITKGTTDDKEFWAKWTVKPYNITYQLNDGTNPDEAPTSYTIESDNITLPTPGKMGYTFDGWFDNEAYNGEAITSIETGSYDDKKYYAKWKERVLYINANWLAYEPYYWNMQLVQDTDNKAVYTHTHIMAVNQDNDDLVDYYFDFKESDRETHAYEYDNVNISYDANYIESVRKYNENEPAIQFGLTRKSDVTITLTLQDNLDNTKPNVTINVNPYYIISFDNTGQNGSAITPSVEAKVGDVLPTATSLPTPQIGYAFMGYWDKEDGQGKQYYKADGTSERPWDKTEDATLYAYFEKAQITQITLNKEIFEPVPTGEAYVIATPTIEPDNVGEVIVCWRLLYNDGTPVEGYGATDADGNEGNSIQFSIVGLATGSYKIEATLHAGSACGNGEPLSTLTKNFIIASEYTVTVKYTCDNQEIKASTTAPAQATETTSITAPDIFGYTFKEWTLGDGVSSESTLTDKTISYTAIYDGTITAKYTKRKLIYLDLSQKFSESGKWSDPYIYLYGSEGYWDNNKGAGATGDACKAKGAMTKIEGTDIWYYDYSNVAGFTKYLAFTWGNSQNKENFDFGDVIYRGDFSEGTPLFVPATDQTKEDINGAKYYSKGYWVNYIGEHTGYTLIIYNQAGNTELIRQKFTSANKRMNMTSVIDLEAEHKYQYEVLRDYGYYYKYNSSELTNTNKGPKPLNTADKGTIVTTAAGDYTFTLGYWSGDLQISVDYPAAVGDYRILYRDTATTNWSGNPRSNNWCHPSRIIKKKEDAKDIISFFINHDKEPELQYQTIKSIAAATGKITWNDAQNIRVDWSQIDTSGVYNFVFVQDGEGISLENTIEPYTGNYYIRCDAFGDKWDNYDINPENRMTYSAFSESEANSFGEKFSHYAVEWCPRGTNVKFTIANDYSPCITDTLIRDITKTWEENMDEHGNLKSDGSQDPTADKYSANIRFMWNRSTNKISRAYLSSATNVTKKFLILQGDEKMADSDGNAIAATTYVPANATLLQDKENWIYETTIKVQPGARVKLYACYTKTAVEDAQYFRGKTGEFNEENTVQILGGGEGDTWYTMRVIYDFKTNRLLAAWIPDTQIGDEGLQIDADIMIIREHQEEATCINLTEHTNSKLTEVKTVYGVMRFNRWVLNNRANPDDLDIDHCSTVKDNNRQYDEEKVKDFHPVLPLGDQKSIYERSLYFISFPFDVKVSDIFGFGTYWNEWYIEYYDGLKRAREGFFIDSPPNWKYVTPEMADTFKLRAYQGYILGVDLDYMQYDNTSFWAHNIQEIELFFPSTTTMGEICRTEVVMPALGPEYECKINRPNSDHRVIDSYWRCIGVPSYANYDGLLYTDADKKQSITWKTDYTWKGDYSEFPFLYAWNTTDNTITPHSTTTFKFKTMHSYLVQHKDKIHWSAISTKPSPIVAKERNEATRNYEWKITLSRNEKLNDQTFIRMADREDITTEFDFNQDLSKEFNYGRSDIYTLIGYEKAAANSLPITETTTLIPLGLSIEYNGDYTIAMPDRMENIGVTLIDTESNTRTNLSAGMEYVVTLNKGDYNNRFFIEISPAHQVPTDIEYVTGDNNNQDSVRKVLIDNILYIVRDGQMFDARGARVK